jgi:C4-dicarboxylate transporter DctQ subunit
VLVKHVRPSLQRLLVVTGLGLGALFTGVIAFFGVRWVVFIYGTGQVSPDLEWPMWVIYLAIPLGSGLMCYRFIQVIIRFIQTHTLPSHTYGEEEDREVAL